MRPGRPDFTFLTGTDSMLMPMLLIGCDGGIHASSGVVPELTRQLYERTVEGKLEEARALQFQVRRLYESMSAAVHSMEASYSIDRSRGDGVSSRTEVGA